MKKVIRILGIFLLLFFTVTTIASCSDDDDPANNEFFAGTYRGSVSYKDADTDISTNDGSVFVTKIASGTKYNFAFSNSIPDLNGIEFEQQGDHTLVMIGSTATSYIRIDNDELKILYTKDGRTWTANCTR